MGQGRASSDRLAWVEFGRGIAASVVVAAHGFYADVPAKFSFMFLWGNWGVCFFFILSGFIIAHVHCDDLGRPDRLANFAWRRLIRIFPTYWLALIVAIFIRQYLGNSDSRLPLDLHSFIQQALLLPGNNTFVPMAWTLKHELLFYTLFGIAILNFRLGGFLLALWLVLLLATLATMTPCEMLTIADRACPIDASVVPTISTVWSISTKILNIYFFVGIGLAVALRFGWIKVVATVAIVLTLLFYFIAAVWGAIYSIALAQAFCCTALVSSAIALSISQIRAPPFAVWFGAISYPLYLFHMTAMLIGHGILLRLRPFMDTDWSATVALSLVLSLFISHSVTFYFERPLYKLVRNRLPLMGLLGTIRESEPARRLRRRQL